MILKARIFSRCYRVCFFRKLVDDSSCTYWREISFSVILYTSDHSVRIFLGNVYNKSPTATETLRLIYRLGRRYWLRLRYEWGALRTTPRQSRPLFLTAEVSPIGISARSPTRAVKHWINGNSMDCIRKSNDSNDMLKQWAACTNRANYSISATCPKNRWTTTGPEGCCCSCPGSIRLLV